MSKSISPFLGGLLVGVQLASVGLALFLRGQVPSTNPHRRMVPKLGHGLDTSHPVHTAMEFMKERLHIFVDTAALLKEGIALQFVRSKAKEWNIDKTRIGAAGESAGDCSSLWLASHDDLADPESEDSVARELTRHYTNRSC